MTTARKPWLADYLALGALWGSSFLFMRFAVVDFGPLPTAAARVAIAALFLTPIVILRGLLPELKQHWQKIFFLGLFNSAIPFACFSFALLAITTGLSGILNATTPMFGALIAWVWLKDKPAPLRIVGIAVGFIGIALLAWDKASFTLDSANSSGIAPGWAVLACLLACVCYGYSASFTKKYTAGISSLVIAYILFFRLIEKAGPQRTLTVTFLIPVFAVFYGAVFLSEVVTLWMLLCAVVIVCGTALATGLVSFKAGPPPR